MDDLGLSSEFRAAISSEGWVSWHIYHKFVTRCPVDLTFLPFDSQICKIEIMNIIMSGLGGLPKVHFKVEQNEVVDSLFELNKGWKLTKTTVRNFLIFDQFCLT